MDTSIPPSHSAPEAPSPTFGGSHSVLPFSGTISRPGSATANIHPAIFLGKCDQSPADSNAAGPAFPLSSNSNGEDFSHIDLPEGRDVTKAAATLLSISSNVSTGSFSADVVEHIGHPVTPLFKRKRPPKLEIPKGRETIVPLNALHVVDLAEDAINDMTVEVSCYGIACKKGRREILEDTHRAIPDLHGDPGQAFFGVFDGHGGRSAADFAADNLVHNITDAMDKSKEGEGSVEAAVRAGYLATDADFLLKRVSSGASCVTAIIQDGYMVVANAGDCRAVLSRAGIAEPLTRDHRAGREDERKRIENLGGFVDDSTGTWRVQGILAVSRGIGDFHLKEWISGEPEVQKFPITPDCEFLILASDGLWDSVSNQEAVEAAHALLQSDRMQAEVMDFDIPLAMASSILSVTGDERSALSIGGTCPAKRSPEEKNSEKRSELESGNENDATVLSTEDDDEVDICVGTMDVDVPDVGIPEPRFPEAGPVAACKKLVEIAVKRGCHDDISVMIVNLHRFQR